MSNIHRNFSTCKVVLRNPKVEIPYQINRFSLVDLASPMLFIQELGNKLVADHRQVIRIANCCVLRLRNINLLFWLLIDFTFLFVRVLCITTAIFFIRNRSDLLFHRLLGSDNCTRWLLSRLVSCSLLCFQSPQNFILFLADLSPIKCFTTLDPSVLIHTLAVQHHKAHHSAVIILIDLAAYVSQVKAKDLITSYQIFLCVVLSLKLL